MVELYPYVGNRLLRDIGLQTSALVLEDVVLRSSRRENISLTSPWSTSFAHGDRLAVMSGNLKMRDEFIGCIYGLVKPFSGQVITRGTISWPLGLKGGLDGKLTLIQNLRFLATVYEDRVAPLDLDKFFNTFFTLAGLSPDQRLKSLKSKDQKDFLYDRFSCLFF